MEFIVVVVVTKSIPQFGFIVVILNKDPLNGRWRRWHYQNVENESSKYRKCIRIIDSFRARTNPEQTHSLPQLLRHVIFSTSAIEIYIQCLCLSVVTTWKSFQKNAYVRDTGNIPRIQSILSFENRIIKISCHLQLFCKFSQRNFNKYSGRCAASHHLLILTRYQTQYQHKSDFHLSNASRNLSQLYK